MDKIKFSDNQPFRHKTHCVICLRKLTQAEIRMTSPYDVNSTCSDHDEYKQFYSIEAARIRAGIGIK